jgi:hypothetical protein
VVGPEEHLEAGGLSPADDRELLVVGETLLRFGHQGETHGPGLLSLPIVIIRVDAIVANR